MRQPELNVEIDLTAAGEVIDIRGPAVALECFASLPRGLQDLATPERVSGLEQRVRETIFRVQPAWIECVTPSAGCWAGCLVPAPRTVEGPALTLYLHDVSSQRREEQLLRGERQILERMARGEDLHMLLEEQTLLIEQMASGLLCSILLLSRDGKHLQRGASPSLPEAYTDAIHGEAIGPKAGSCGTAAFTGKLTIVSDIATDPLWEDYKDLALGHGLRACWSAPILSSEERVLGTFAMYYRQPGEPQAFHYDLIRHATDLCSIAIERHNAEHERRRLEQQVLHVQKLESLGVLAGGIAHDFNNILTTILGNADLALCQLPTYTPARDHLKEIEVGARRAADLATQMLAYSGKGKFKIQTIEINQFVEEMLYLLQVSISKQVVLKLKFADNLPPIVGDATQVRQVIMNLVTNASESMGERSGVISVTTGAMHCDSQYLKSVDMITWDPTADNDQSGLYVYVEVTDTGAGMTEEVLERIFEPFYTTKLTGRGLGLAATLGIMRGHKGGMKVYSEVGRGSTFKALFPVSKDAALTETQPSKAEESSARTQLSGTVLLVDDEETIRSLSANFMRSFGLTVVIAIDGQDAVDVYREQGDEIDVVLLDLTMPRMDGHEAFRELRRIDPHVDVVLCSGYSETDILEQFSGKRLADVLHKPYSSKELYAVLAPLLPLKV